MARKTKDRKADKYLRKALVKGWEACYTVNEIDIRQGNV